MQLKKGAGTIIPKYQPRNSARRRHKQKWDEMPLRQVRTAALRRGRLADKGR